MWEAIVGGRGPSVVQRSSELDHAQLLHTIHVDTPRWHWCPFRCLFLRSHQVPGQLDRGNDTLHHLVPGPHCIRITVKQFFAQKLRGTHPFQVNRVTLQLVAVLGVHPQEVEPQLQVVYCQLAVEPLAEMLDAS